MSKSKYIAAAGTAFVLAASVSTVALAWHPQGKITKSVMDITTNSAYADANDVASALTVHPGDTLRYKIEIVNPADPAANHDNDLGSIKVADTLPAGVTLASGASSKDFGSYVVVPQNSTSGNKSATYDYTVTVSKDAKDGSTICNVANFTANSAVGDAPRNGSDQACVKVVVPPAPKQLQVCELATKSIVTITEDKFDASKYSKDLTLCAAAPVTPTTPATPETPAPVTELPSTGSNTPVIAAGATALAALAYGAVAFVQRRR